MPVMSRLIATAATLAATCIVGYFTVRWYTKRRTGRVGGVRTVVTPNAALNNRRSGGASHFRSTITGGVVIVKAAGTNVEMLIPERPQPFLRVAALRHVGPYQSVGAAFAKLTKWVEGKRFVMAGVYYDDPATTAAALLTADICVVLPQGLAVNETRRALPLSVKFLGGGHEAVVTHRGPYETLSSTYDAIFTKLLPASKRRCNGRPYEVYVNQGVAPSHLITEIHVPLLS